MKIVIKFLIAGIINTLFFYILYAVLIYAGMHYSVAVLIATFIGMIFSFKTFGKFVFQKEDNSLIIRFALLTIFNYFFNLFNIAMLKNIGFNDYIAGLISVMIVAVSSFLLNKYYVFR